MRGVILSDDHDKLTKDNVKVTWNPKTNGNQDTTENTGTSRTIEGEPIVGVNTLQYIVTDSWGRLLGIQKLMEIKIPLKIQELVELLKESL